MVYPFNPEHPEGEVALSSKSILPANFCCGTHGRAAFFIRFLKLGGRFDPWIYECPLHYQSKLLTRIIHVVQIDSHNYSS